MPERLPHALRWRIRELKEQAERDGEAARFALDSAKALPGDDPAREELLRQAEDLSASSRKHAATALMFLPAEGRA